MRTREQISRGKNHLTRKCVVNAYSAIATKQFLANVKTWLDSLYTKFESKHASRYSQINLKTPEQVRTNYMHEVIHRLYSSATFNTNKNSPSFHPDSSTGREVNYVTQGQELKFS